MKKCKKIVGTLVATFFLLSSTSLIAHAATYYDYETTVPAVADYESKPKKKKTTGSAYNKVGSIQKNRTLVSWIENTKGKNITSKNTYSSKGKKTMDYKGNASKYKGKKVRLNISTSTTTMKRATTSGEWTPN